jgi:hypothetical protein
MTSEVIQRGTVGFLRLVTAARGGVINQLMEPLVDQLGPWRALYWCGRNLPRYEYAVARSGPVRTHLLAATVSVINNSTSCARSQGIALKTAYCRLYGRDFPFHEDQWELLCGETPVVVRHRLLTAVRKAGLHTDALWLSRTIELAAAPAPCAVYRDDLRIEHMVRTVRALNEVVDNTPLAGSDGWKELSTICRTGR